MTLATRLFDLLLRIVTLALLLALAVIVLLGVAYRYSGASLIWYDEAASVLLAWITFIGAALAMLMNAHLGFAGLLYGLPRRGRVALLILVEIIVLGSLGIVVWGGWAILGIFAGETLVSLRFIPRAFVQSALPIGAVLMIVARLLTLPERWRDVVEGLDPEAKDIAEEIARAQAELEASR